MKIANLTARKILNSAGNETVECNLETNEGKTANASIPQGISTGKTEKEIVPTDKAILQIEKEILSKVRNINLDQESLDEVLEKGDWGANATLAVSAAAFKLSSPNSERTKLPSLMMLLFEGEKHGNPNLTIQEFMAVVKTVEEGIALYKKVKVKLQKDGVITTVGEEGGFSPPNFTDEQILKFITKIGVKNIALDIAGNINPPTPDSLLNIVRCYSVISLEDPFSETSKKKWKHFSATVRVEHPNLLVVADDLTVTDLKKIKQGAEQKLFNAVVIKPNQCGTISLAVKAIEMAKSLELKTIVSHRGEETNDTWIADFAIAFEADFVKFGAPSKGERIAKYNRLSQLTA